MNATKFPTTVGSLLVVIANDEYTTGTASFLRFYLNQTEKTIDVPIPANSYIYLTNSVTPETVIGASVFDEKDNMMVAPWSYIRATFTEFAVLVAPTIFSFNGITL